MGAGFAAQCYISRDGFRDGASGADSAPSYLARKMPRVEEEDFSDAGARFAARCEEMMITRTGTPMPDTASAFRARFAFS